MTVFDATDRVSSQRGLPDGIEVASTASAMARPSTRSPRNSSRWLSSRVGEEIEGHPVVYADSGPLEPKGG